MDKVGKEMMLRMVIRCNKVRKHSPKKVKTPIITFKVDGSELTCKQFTESEIAGRPYWRRADTKGVRDSLRNLL